MGMGLADGVLGPGECSVHLPIMRIHQGSGKQQEVVNASKGDGVDRNDCSGRQSFRNAEIHNS